MKVRIKKLYDEAIIPEYQTDGAACMDLHAVVTGNYNYDILRPGETKIIKTGLAMEVPKGWELQVRARSGLGSRGIIPALGVGTVDSDYRGDIGVGLTNVSNELLQINTGDRIGQCKLERVEKVTWDVVDELSDTERGEGGFGSTGS